MGNHGQTTSVNGVVCCHLVWRVDANRYQEIQKSIRQINRSTFPDRTVWLKSRYATANGNITIRCTRVAESGVLTKTRGQSLRFFKIGYTIFDIPVPVGTVADWSQAKIGYTLSPLVLDALAVADWSQAKIGYTLRGFGASIHELRIGLRPRLVTLAKEGWEIVR